MHEMHFNTQDAQLSPAIDIETTCIKPVQFLGLRGMRVRSFYGSDV